MSGDAIGCLPASARARADKLPVALCFSAVPPYFFANSATAGVLPSKCSLTCSMMFSGVVFSTGISSW